MFRWYTIFSAIVVALCSLAGNQSEGADDVSRAPLAMFNDEYYRRDGALTKLNICLAVADDHDAVALLQGLHVDTNDPTTAYELADVLVKGSDEVKQKAGFGILLTCAEIVRAWYALPASGADDGRRVHGTIVIDLAFGFGDRQRGLLAPVPLVRILTSPGLLPKASFGGIVIRNARIDGTLVFHNVHLSMPLSLVHVTFKGGDYNKAVYGKTEPVTDTALSIIHSKFEDHIQIAASEMCGHVRIIDSELAETLAFEDVEQMFVDCKEPQGEASKPSRAPFVKIEGSRFGQTLSIVRSTFGSLKMDGNDVDSFVSSRSDFGSVLQMWEHDIGSLQINCSALAALVHLSYNHIDKDFFIKGRQHAKVKFENGETCARWWHKNEIAPGRKTTIVLESNKIGGGLGLQGLDGPTLTSSISLKSNRVGNGSIVELPAANVEELPVTARNREPWRGLFDLKGSTYLGTVEIKVGKGAPPVDPVSFQDDYCTPVSSSEGPRHAVVDLTAAKIRTLKWNLPFACDYRWRGYGLDYDLWIAGEAAKRSVTSNASADDQSILPTWRQTLETHDAASLSAMSRYLDDKGSTVDSRTLLVEAKRLNYAKDCPPDWLTWACAFHLSGIEQALGWMWQGSTSHAEESAAASVMPAAQQERPLGEFLGTLPLQAWEWFSSLAMLFILWPGGYGAAPERAILLSAVFVFVFCAIYELYARWLRRELDKVPSYAKDLRGFRAKLIIPSDADSVHDDDADGPTFEQITASIDALIKKWPKELPWSHLHTNEKLDVVQKSLVIGVRDSETLLSGPALDGMKDLRERLERFGDTERLGFSLFDRGKMPTRFTHWHYSIDAMLPFIDLHAFNSYYPAWWPVRRLSVLQHVLGWWWLTVFIASAAIL